MSGEQDRAPAAASVGTALAPLRGQAPTGLEQSRSSTGAEETQEQRARRLFDEMARNIGRETVNYLKRMYPEIFSERGRQSKSWEISCTNHIRNDINWRMRPLLMAMIAMHNEWEEEAGE